MYQHMIRVGCANHNEADAAWRMLNAIPDALFQPVELHLDGHGPLCLVIRTENGDQSAAPVAAVPARSSLG